MSQKKCVLAKIAALLLSFILSAGTLFIFPISVGAAGQTTNHFIVPLVQQTTVPDGFMAVYTPEDLKNISLDLSGSYILMNDIDLSTVSVSPIGGSSSTPFTGILDGNGYCIKNFRGSKGGLFGYVQGAQIRNLGMVDAFITCPVVTSDVDQYGHCAGAIANYADNAAIQNCYNTGNINGLSIGSTIYLTMIGASYPSPAVVGGIVGSASNNTSINMCYNTGNIAVGVSGGSTIAEAGGIVGELNNSKVSDCYNTGRILAAGNETDTLDVGGIVGAAGFTSMLSSAGIANCYNAGELRIALEADMADVPNVSVPVVGNLITAGIPAAQNRLGFGGIAGYLSSPDTSLIKHCYYRPNAYYEELMVSDIGNDTEASGAYAIPLTNEQMCLQESFIGFDFDHVWKMEEHGYPVFKYAIFVKAEITPKDGATTVIDNENKFIYGLAEGLTDLHDFVDVVGGELAYHPMTAGFGTGTAVDLVVGGEVIETYTIVIFGDVSGDGVVDAFDQTMLTAVANLEISLDSGSAYELAGDVNGDGVVDVFDQTLLTAVANFETAISQAKPAS